MKAGFRRSLSTGLSIALLSCLLTGCDKAHGSEALSDSAGSKDLEQDTYITAEDVTSMEISKTVTLSLQNSQKFNDTNKDGYGEFQGWGTSLCWWANRVGYSEELTLLTVEAFFDKEKGLGMNIGRYNVGGGDDVCKGAVSKEAKEADPFLHQQHIQRSDSAVPGYCTDVTKIDLESNPESYYKDNFDRADFECGYAWNYDWEADANQMNVLKAAADAAGDEFIAEAFSNSPPYFMTVSGCSSGGVDPSVDNLREDSYTAFAAYMADVIEHWMKEGVITFQSVDPMNEPATDYWSAYSPKQEGCHFSQGDSQSRILTALNDELKAKGIDIIICASDETSIDAAVNSYNALSDDAKSVVTRIDTHSYQGTQYSLLKETALEAGVNLWMSEVDGTYTIGNEDTKMQAALGFSGQIIKDINGLMPTAWIMWDAVDIHVDTDNIYDTCTIKEAEDIVSKGVPFWGIAIADHDSKELLLSKKYYAFGQFTRYIRPGYCILGTDDKANQVTAAYNPEDGSIVIVAMNTRDEDVKWEIDLSEMNIKDDNSIQIIRTSGDMESGENWADVTDSSYAQLNDDRTKLTIVLKNSSVTTFVIG
ncbi:glycoside hydrolase [Butyrivibrio fibrisolvens]|uniref:glycoside hydrolase n=1 Tax=Butyrivibrio fibrisolvens TaxID=831 RepID=UPI0020BD7C6E|nr:glycoside hydrolase [Butyrivibrio fibrisolvens]